MNPPRRWLLAAATVAALSATSPAVAQPWPSRPVTMIVPASAGGPTDVMARLIGQKLSEKFGQTFVIENHGGAAGNIGMGNAARAPGDGYTILFVSSSCVVNPSLYNKVPYDPDKDFLPVTKAVERVVKPPFGQSVFVVARTPKQ